MRVSKELHGVSAVIGPGEVMAAEAAPPNPASAAVRLGSTGRLRDVPGASALAQGYVYAVLADQAAGDGTVPDEIALLDNHGQRVWVKANTAAIGRAACGMSRRGAQRVLEALRDAKLLRVVERAGRAPAFVVLLPGAEVGTGVTVSPVPRCHPCHGVACGGPGGGSGRRPFW